MTRGETMFRTAAVLSVIYIGVLLSQPALQTGSASGAASGNVTTEQGNTPLLSTAASNVDEGLALLSLSNAFTASKVLFGLTASSLSYLVHLPKVVYIPAKHAFAVLSYVAHLFLRPLHRISAPVHLAVKIIFTPVLVPLLLVYRFAVLLYPLYVFLGAAAICGALAGILARRLGKAVVEDVLGVRRLHRTGSDEVTETSPGHGGHLRGKG